ncbi:MAG: L-aspartate oxidase [Myxococcales bacterium]|nr:L-aspartate oxidase [Myxococcales bacterium]
MQGNHLQTDVLVIGSGIAGATAALQLADAGVDVLMVTRAREPEESNTYYAQGGIIYEGKGDSKALLIEDLERAGAGHCNPEAVALLASEGPRLVREILLEKVGVDFDHTRDGDLSLVREGSHAASRIIHAADATGKAIEIALLRKLKQHPHVTILSGHTAIDLLTPSHHSQNRLAVYEPHACVGAYVLDQTSGEVLCCLAKKTVLATGGLGQIFLRTTNPQGARGDGLAMAYRAGARVINAEFVQFHPTAFYMQDAARFLISEAVRGEGARLVDAAGTPFMQRYDAEWKDLAPRDVVARSIHREMLQHAVSHVYLDLRSYIERDRILQHFPNIHQKCLQYGVDITKDLVPVVPAAHYACGGVWADGAGRTTLQHLYAIGEVSCTGVHGANRLASASLLEALVWGARAAEDICAVLPETTFSPRLEIPPWTYIGSELPDPALVSQDMSSIKHIMWNYVGLVRTTRRLERAIRELRNLETEIEEFYRAARIHDSLIGLRNAVRTALIVAQAAWTNRRSMGCHYRE